MNETRTIKELLQLMLENKQCFEEGLCKWSSNIYNKDLISCKEETIIQSYLYKNEPIYAGKFYPGTYWFPVGEIEPRIKWLEEQIKKPLKKENEMQVRY